MKKIAVITPIYSEFGFKLAGVSHHVTREEEAESTIRSIIREPDVGLLVVDERLLKGVTEEKLKEIEKSWHGVIVALPSPKRPEVEIEDFAVRLIRRAIGYHVRIRL